MITASSDSCNPPCIIPSSCMWTGPNDSLLTNIIQQKLWESLLKLGCKKTTAFILHVLSCSLLLICCDEIWLRCAEAHLARNWGRLWLNTSEEPRPSDHVKLNSANNHMSELSRRSSLIWGFQWNYNPRQHLQYSLVRNSEAEASR